MSSSKPNAKRQFDASIPLAEPGGRTIYLRWRIVLTIVLLIVLILLTMVASTPPKAEAAARNSASPAPSARPLYQALTQPKVVAFYYTWFDESSWNSSLSDQPPQGYVSRDRAIMGRHIEQAQQAGIDAFIVAWYGPTPNQTESNLTALLEEAAARNFQIGILFETNSPLFSGTADITNALIHARSVHMPHPAYLRTSGGQPVLFFWRTEDHAISTWQSIRSQVDPGHSAVWIGDGINTAYLAVFEGHHLYSNTWNPPSDLGYTNQKFATRVAQASSQFGAAKSWVATVMPGYNDVGIRPGSGFAQSREGGGYFDRSWQAAINSQPAWIVINSFNEWPEGSYIEPSVSYGDLFLQKSAQWSQQFKQGGSGSQPIITAAAQPAVPQPAVVQSSQPQSIQSQSEQAVADDPNQAKVAVGLLNLRRSPGTESEVLAILAEDTPVAVIGAQDEWVQIEVNGEQGWVFASMISGPRAVVSTTAGPTTVAQTVNTNSAPLAPSTTPSTTAQISSRKAPASASAETPKKSLPRFIPYRGPQLGDTVSVDVSILNLRSGPGTNNAVLLELQYGAKLVVEDASASDPEWIRVRPLTSSTGDNAPLGWVLATMVK